MRTVATMLLTRLGYHVLQAGDAREALEILEAEVPIDLLVTDIGLPGDVNGLGLAAAVRDRLPGTRVLFLSGYSEGAAANLAERDPAAGFLAKPYDRVALATAVRKSLDSDLPENSPPAESAC